MCTMIEMEHNSTHAKENQYNAMNPYYVFFSFQLRPKQHHLVREMRTTVTDYNMASSCSDMREKKYSGNKIMLLQAMIRDEHDPSLF